MKFIYCLLLSICWGVQIKAQYHPHPLINQIFKMIHDDRCNKSEQKNELSFDSTNQSKSVLISHSYNSDLVKSDPIKEKKEAEESAKIGKLALIMLLGILIFLKIQNYFEIKKNNK